MGSQSRSGIRQAKCDTELLTDESPLFGIGDIVVLTDEWHGSRRTPGQNSAATNEGDGVEWLARVLRCALYGQPGHETER
jgi:hypothetical protein